MAQKHTNKKSNTGKNTTYKKAVKTVGNSTKTDKKSAPQAPQSNSVQYDHLKIEKKWQKEWARTGIYKTKENDGKNKGKPKAYILDMFPYPSGSGLHVGHPRGYIATDVYSRYKTMTGHNVLHPMGWDAFGLPAEEFALKNKIHPAIAMKKNVARYKEQLSILGLNYDWSREVNTTDPEYYKWTQWAFLQMHKKGLTYESHEPINWCPSCKTGLANEDLEDGKCERCGSVVEKKPIRQWVIKITKYADRLLEDLVELNWPDSIKESQRNWIGRSEGAEFDFPLVVGGKEIDQKITVFTTRCDTLFGVTYVVLAPEHKLVVELLGNNSAIQNVSVKNADKVRTFINSVKEKTDIERTAEGKEKSGIALEGVEAINPATGEKVPVWIADYVLAGYGTGAVMAVPAHDERDFKFAKKYGLGVKQVIYVADGNFRDEENAGPLLEDGQLMNSSNYDDMNSAEARTKIAVEFGRSVVNYKLRDWVFSRQRYWGEPIPLVHCSKCGVVPVPEKELPIKLPNVKSYEPTGTGESPLAAISKWVNTKCPVCKAPAKRETNTMPQWAGSCWYYLRYIDPKNKKALVDPKKEKYWQPVNMYVGGAEHATRHLIYARFWHKFLFDIGVVSTKEPFTQLKNQGLIAGPDGRKMSKRFGNVVNPDDVVKLYGADTLRVYEMFMGPFDSGIAWSTDNMIGSRRFIERVWRLGEKVAFSNTKNSNDSSQNSTNKDLESLMHRTIKKVTDDIEAFNMNTAISTMMIYLNSLEAEVKNGNAVSGEMYEMLLKLLAPFAPHATDELWVMYFAKIKRAKKPAKSIHLENWPTYDPKKLESTTFRIVVQVNSKVRGTFISGTDIEADVISAALALPEIKQRIGDKKPSKTFYVKGKLVNLVVDGI